MIVGPHSNSNSSFITNFGSAIQGNLPSPVPPQGNDTLARTPVDIVSISQAAKDIVNGLMEPKPSSIPPGGGISIMPPVQEVTTDFISASLEELDVSKRAKGEINGADMFRPGEGRNATETREFKRADLRARELEVELRGDAGNAGNLSSNINFYYTMGANGQKYATGGEVNYAQNQEVPESETGDFSNRLRVLGSASINQEGEAHNAGSVVSQLHSLSEGKESKPRNITDFAALLKPLEDISGGSSLDQFQGAEPKGNNLNIVV